MAYFLGLTPLLKRYPRQAFDPNFSKFPLLGVVSDAYGPKCSRDAELTGVPGSHKVSRYLEKITYFWLGKFGCLSFIQKSFENTKAIGLSLIQKMFEH